MANPRVFISSTYYDLKHVRSSLDLFIESLGYDSVLSEKGDIAYSPDMPLDESCYREVSSADIFVLIVGGRYGSETSDGGKKKSKDFFERYESVTKKEFEESIKRDIPTYVLVEQSVYSEYHTYLRNKESKNISYAHVDSVNIFKFLEQILSLPRNNPTHTFEKFSDIESWLREQWSGLFRELLKRMSEQKKFAELSHQVEGLKDINKTLKTYLESVMKVVSPAESVHIIESESKRLIKKQRFDAIKDNHLACHIHEVYHLDFGQIIEAATVSKSVSGFVSEISKSLKSVVDEEMFRDLMCDTEIAFQDLNLIRSILGFGAFRRPGGKKSNKSN